VVDEGPRGDMLAQAGAANLTDAFPRLIGREHGSAAQRDGPGERHEEERAS
jgi:hypothetical protein